MKENIIEVIAIIVITMGLVFAQGCAVLDPPTSDMIAIEQATLSGRISTFDLTTILRNSLPDNVEIDASGLTEPACFLPTSNDVWSLVTQWRDGGPWINEYSAPDYVCVDFAIDCRKRLRREGWPCGIVYRRDGMTRTGLFGWGIKHSWVRHAENLVVCTDGIFIVDPQTNEFSRIRNIDPRTIKIQM